MSIGSYFQVLSILRLEGDLLLIAKDDIFGRKIQDAGLITKKRAPKTFSKQSCIMVNFRKQIYVYADWIGLRGAELMGVLSIDVIRGSEVFAFSYEKKWFKSGFSMQLDSDLQLYVCDL